MRQRGHAGSDVGVSRCVTNLGYDRGSRGILQVPGVCKADTIRVSGADLSLFDFVQGDSEVSLRHSLGVCGPRTEFVLLLKGCPGVRLLQDPSMSRLPFAGN